MSFGEVWREGDPAFWDGMWGKHKDSPMTKRLSQIAMEAENSGRSKDEVREIYARSSSLRAFVTTDDIAEMVLFLSSPAGAKISGQALAVDGHTEYLTG